MPISWEIAFLPRVLKIHRFWPKRKGPILADFHNWTLADLKNKKYLSNLSENGLIWRRIYWRFCENKNYQKQIPISWEIAFLPRVLKIHRFWPKRKGPILADFHNWTFAVLKKRNTYQIWLKIIYFDAEFIEDFVKTKTSKNQCLLSEK